jgi:hypothetical protein
MSMPARRPDPSTQQALSLWYALGDQPSGMGMPEVVEV